MSEARKPKSPAKRRSKDAVQKDFDEFVRVCRVELLESRRWPAERIDRVKWILAFQKWGSVGSYEKYCRTQIKKLLTEHGLADAPSDIKRLGPGQLISSNMDDAEAVELRLSDDPDDQYRLRDQIYLRIGMRLPLTFHMAVWLDGVLKDSGRKYIELTDARALKAVEDFRVGAGMRALRNQGRARRNSGSRHAAQFTNDPTNTSKVHRIAKRFTRLLDVIEEASGQKLSSPMTPAAMDAIKSDPLLCEGLSLWNEHLFLTAQPDRVVSRLIDVLHEHDLLQILN